MTKKHYEAIARIIKFYHLLELGYGKSHYSQKIAETLSLEFAQDNKNFDRERFLTACGIKQTCSHKNCSNIVDDEGDECRKCYETK
jgi:hypothetical protein